MKLNNIDRIDSMRRKMEKAQLDSFFANMDFHAITTGLPEVEIYFTTSDTQILAFCTVDLARDTNISEREISLCKEQAIAMFRSRGFIEMHILTILLTRDIQTTKRILQKNPFYWQVDIVENRLIIFENQVEDFYGMRKKLESFLEEIQLGNMSLSNEKTEERKIIVTLSLIGSNVIIYLISAITGGLLYNKGAFSIVFLINGRQQYYRFITSIFLHAGLPHLMGNMILLFAVGAWVEKYCGSIKYSVIYFISGIVGSIFSAVGELVTGTYVLSVGASGAIMGLIGALLAIVIFHRGIYKDITTGRVLFMIAYIIYSGLTTSNVNNLAHIGGLTSGFLMMLIIFQFQNMWNHKRKESRYED